MFAFLNSDLQMKDQKKSIFKTAIDLTEFLQDKN